MIGISDMPALLDELCVKLGLCLSPGDRARISITPYRDLDSFANAVLIAEGIEPVTTNRRLRHDLLETIAPYVIEAGR
jgi:hypothetical protein